MKIKWIWIARAILYGLCVFAAALLSLNLSDVPLNRGKVLLWAGISLVVGVVTSLLNFVRAVSRE